MANEAWAVSAAVASIAFACAIYYTAIAWFAHREQMAKIQQGIELAKIQQGMPLGQPAQKDGEGKGNAPLFTRSQAITER
jgi:hypothetical protein